MQSITHEGKIEAGTTYTQAEASLTWYQAFLRYKTYLKPYIPGIAAMLVIVLLSPAVSAAIVWLVKILIDQVITPDNLKLLLPVLLIYIGLILLQEILGFLDNYISTWVGERFILQVQTDLYHHLHTLPPDALARQRIGDLLIRLEGDTNEIESIVFSTFLEILGSVGMVVFYVFALILLDWHLTVIAILIAPLMWAIALYFSRRFRVLSLQRQAAAGESQSAAEEALQANEIIQAYNRQEYVRNRYFDVNMLRVRLRLKNTFLQSIYSTLLQLLITAGAVAVIWVGAIEISAGRFTVGALVAFMGYIGSLYTPLRSLSRTGGNVQAALASADRLETIWQLQDPVQDQPNAQTVGEGRYEIEFKDVSFAYSQDQPALEHVSLEVPAGQTLAVVGPSGSGKTTIARLLLRLYDPDSGQILLDGRDLREYQRGALREHLSVVFQESLLLDTTIHENIRFGKLDATEEEIITAAVSAHAHEFISHLPDGYQSRIGQRGQLLSAGQRQRIAIARAFIRNPALLILDEATSALDAISEAIVQSSLEGLMKGRTTIIIAHRLVTTRHANWIAVMNEGRVVEKGTHAELLAAPTLYRELCREQGLYIDELTSVS